MSVRFGKYVLHERVGAGGMAEVWRATLPGAGGIDKPCVLKRILPSFAGDPGIVQMFLEEARISITLQHGNIVPVLDFGEAAGSYYLAMEYVAGKDLRALLARIRADGGQFPIGLATFVTIEVCRGLSYAHAKTGPDGTPMGLVHRDVSPSNILVSYEGDVRLVDFGIAKVQARSTHTQSSSLKGKIPYMSPEQARGQPVDARTDIWAAGVVLYEMLIGRRPFVGRDPMHTLDLVRAGEFEPPRSLRPEIPSDLDEVVRIALARDAAARFQEARAMQVVLGRFLAHYESTVTGADLARFLRDTLGEDLPGPGGDDTPEVARDPTDSFERALLHASGAAAGSGRRAPTLPTRPARPRVAAQAGEAPGEREPTSGVPSGEQKPTLRGGPAWSDAEPETASVGGSPPPAEAHGEQKPTLRDGSAWSDADPETILAGGSAPASKPAARTSHSTGGTVPHLRPGSKRRPRWRGAAAAAAAALLAGGAIAVVMWDPPDAAVLPPSPATPRQAAPSAVAPAPDRVRASPAVPGLTESPSVSLPAAALALPAAGLAPAMEQARPAKEARSGVTTGLLIVHSTPWAEVWIDGRRRAESTPATVRLPAGAHVVRLVNPEISVRRSERVVVRAGDATRLVLKLR